MSAARVVFLFLLATALAGAPVIHAAAGGMEFAEFGGTRYVRVGDWARANSFDARWVQKDEMLQLTNRLARLVFTKDSKVMELSGVNVTLSYPVVMRDGAAYISEVDVQTAVRPVLWPPKNSNGAKIKMIVIDPGHGGNDPGFEVGSHKEKDYTLLLAKELMAQLKHAGFSVSLTRTSDNKVDLVERADMANRRHADLFISLHWNSLTTSKSEVKGAQTYCLTPVGASSSNAEGQVADAGAKQGNRNNEKNMFLAYELQKSLVRNLGVEDRGVKRARFAVLCNATMPAVLIEGGFMSHPSESRKIYDPVYRKQMAQALVQGVQAYQRAVEPAK